MLLQLSGQHIGVLGQQPHFQQHLHRGRRRWSGLRAAHVLHHLDDIGRERFGGIRTLQGAFELMHFGG